TRVAGASGFCAECCANRSPPLRSCYPRSHDSDPGPQTSGKLLLRQAGLSGVLLGEADQLGPGDDEAVIGARFLGAAFAGANGVEPMRQVAGDVGLAAELAEEDSGRRFSLVQLGAEQVLGCLPDRGTVCTGLPTFQ